MFTLAILTYCTFHVLMSIGVASFHDVDREIEDFSRRTIEVQSSEIQRLVSLLTFRMSLYLFYSILYSLSWVAMTCHGTF